MFFQRLLKFRCRIDELLPRAVALRLDLCHCFCQLRSLDHAVFLTQQSSFGSISNSGTPTGWLSEETLTNGSKKPKQCTTVLTSVPNFNFGCATQCPNEDEVLIGRKSVAIKPSPWGRFSKGGGDGLESK